MNITAQYNLSQEFGKMLKGGGASAKDLLGKAWKVIGTPWNMLPAGEEANLVRSMKIGGCGLFGFWAAANALRSFTKASDIMHLQGDVEGSIVWSGAQGALYGLSGIISASALLLQKGPTAWLMKTVPIAGLLPGVVALGMEHFETLAISINHPLTKLTQFGKGNFLLMDEDYRNPGSVFRSVFYPWWEHSVRGFDEKFFHAIGFKNFQRTALTFETGHKSLLDGHA